MRLPTRRWEKLKNREDETAVIYLTPAGKQRLEREVDDLEHVQQRQAAEDVARTGAMGDLSENAEYQEAKHRLARIHGRIFSIKDRLRRVVLIQKQQAGGVIALGSTVTLEIGGKERIYELVGSSEVNPSRGRISHVSPLGQALLGHKAADVVVLTTENGEMTYLIKSVQ
ncbi:transcription elongation factor GreA [Patescibacteria group bacterium]|nr:transcription elongation factor GreA [Patescibacteria group bacterium]